MDAAVDRATPAAAEATTCPDPAWRDDHRRMLDAAIDVFTRRSYRSSGMQDVADQAGMPLDAVQAHFPSWQLLVLATLQHWQAGRTDALLPVARDEGVLVAMRRIVEDTVADPSLGRLLVSVLAEATDPSHACAPYLQTRYAAFHERVLLALEHDIAVGRLPVDLHAEHATQLLMALWEGLLMQLLLRPGFDMAAAFDRGLGMLVRDWGVGQDAPSSGVPAGANR